MRRVVRIGLAVVLVAGFVTAGVPASAAPRARAVTTEAEVRDAVTRLYLGILGRAPDAEGLAAWVGQYRRPASITTMAGGFLASAEYAERFGRPDDPTFVTLLYRNMLRREPDPGGLDGWVTALQRGTSRATVAAGITQSPEAVQVTGTLPPPAGAVASGGGGGAATAGSRAVALTFDDGPSGYTPQVLDVLGRYGVSATFFPVGYLVPGRADVVARAAREGHSVQNHTWSHAWLTRLSSSGVAAQLNRASDAIQSATGVRPTCYRPPYGASSARVRSVAASAGLREVRWTVETNDYLRPSPWTIARRVLSRADGRGLVVLLHDGGGNRANTVAALPAIIEGLQARGYTFVTLCG